MAKHTIKVRLFDTIEASDKGLGKTTKVIISVPEEFGPYARDELASVLLREGYLVQNSNTFDQGYFLINILALGTDVEGIRGAVKNFECNTLLTQQLTREETCHDRSE